MKTEIVIALARNQHPGKITIFNTLKGMQHRVGNYPGAWWRGRRDGAATEGLRSPYFKRLANFHAADHPHGRHVCGI